MSDRFEIRLSGAGGQGLITAGVILAEAAVLDGKNVVQTQSYGPAARLGASKAEVVISPHPIADPQVHAPDLLLCLSQESFDRYGRGVGDDTMLMIDTTNVETDGLDGPGRRFRLPITQRAVEIGGKVVANVVALGAINVLTPIVSAESLAAAVANRVPARAKDLNLAALAAGGQLVEKGALLPG